MIEIRTVLIDPKVHPEPVFRTLVSAYTWLIELCYDVRVGDTEEFVEVSLFRSYLQRIHYESAWKPFDHVGLKALSRERALMDIEALLAAKMPEDLNAFETLGDQCNAWMKFSAFVQGFKPTVNGIQTIMRGESPRIHLYNIVGTGNKREYTWDLVLNESQEFAFNDPREVFIPTLINHTDRPTPEPMPISPGRTYRRKSKE